MVEVEWGVFSLAIVNFEKPMEEFDPEAGQWRPAAGGTRSQLDLVAGGGRLLRLQDGP